MSLDQKLKSLRIEHKMTQNNVASYLHVARSTIAGYETKNRQPSHEKLTALAELFHVSVDFLINDNDFVETSCYVAQDELALISLYRSLSETSKKELTELGQLLKIRDQKKYYR